MQITHLGHACLLVETASARLLIDPGTLSSFADLTDLDAVLVTHEHADHVDAAAVRSLMDANPSATLVVDDRTVTQFAGRASVRVAQPGDVLDLGERVEVLGGIHAPVWGDIPGCPNLAYLVGDGEVFHPGDSLTLPGREVGTLAVPIDGPWLKFGEAVDYLRAVEPTAYLPIHEGELKDVEKYVGMLAGLSGR
jgi:L-ascorbate metabolism protein UlaG (beta-lactamase superfamily)